MEQSTHKKTILVVDDEASIRDSLRLLLKSNFDVLTAQDGLSALEMLKSETPDLVLLDVMMPKLDGLSTLERLRKDNKKLPVIMLTADTTVKNAVSAMKLGASDYLSKPFDVEALTQIIVNVLNSSGSPVAEASELVADQELETIQPDGDFGPLVGTSAVMQEVYEKVSAVAERDTTILITGQSGTGKELVARQIHDLSLRQEKPFVAINCAAIPENLIESELFGHEKGAFTSAVDKRIGYFELADGGTIFLDEIGELSMPVQVKMLRFLQEQEFYRVGQSKPVRVNVRVIAATNKNLEELIKEKKFRQDLFYRINVINMELPALCKRKEDIETLIKHFIAKFASQYGNRKLVLEDATLSVLRSYNWPGNVRELENVIESLMALAPNDKVSAADLPYKLKKSVEKGDFDPAVFDGSLNFEEAERAFETEMIQKALLKSDHVQTKAAELLGISRRILKYKMDKLGISASPESEQIADSETVPKVEKKAEAESSPVESDAKAQVEQDSEPTLQEPNIETELKETSQ